MMTSDIQPLAIGIAISVTVGAVCYAMHEKEGKVKGILSCPCGKVKGKLSAPTSTPTAACHCEDCVEFLKWSRVNRKSPVSLTRNHGGTDMVQLYKNQFQWVCGSEQVERVRLRDDSPLERLCTTCCGTPIGFSSAHFGGFPLFVVHTELLSYTSTSPFQKVKWRLNVARVSKEERTWEGANKDNSNCDPQCVVTEGLAPSFLLRVLSRVVYGMMEGNAQPDPMTQVPPGFTVLGLNVKG